MVFHRDSCVESAVLFLSLSERRIEPSPDWLTNQMPLLQFAAWPSSLWSAIDLVHRTDRDSGSTLPLLPKKNLLLAMLFFFACIMTLPITTKSRPDTPTQAIKIHDNLYNKYWGNFVSYHICLIIVIWFGKNLFHPCKIGLRDIIKKNPRLLHIWLSVFLKQNK